MTRRTTDPAAFQASGPPRRDRRRGPAAVAWLFAVLLIAGSACGSEAPGESGRPAPEHHHTAATVEDGVIDLVAEDHRFRPEHLTVRAGTTQVRLTNRGRVAHQVQIGRLNAAMTPERFIQMFGSDGDRATVDALNWVGGVAVVGPGRSGTAQVDLTPGDYLLVCYVTDRDGTSHVMEGMVAPLHVVAGDARTPEPPIEPSETVVLDDYWIEVPSGFRGRGPVEFRNDGSDPHEAVLLRLEDGRTLADVVAYQDDPTAPQPFTFAGGTASIDGGRSSMVTLDLQPGDYIAACFVPARNGTPHVDLGMVTTFTVT